MWWFVSMCLQIQNHLGLFKCQINHIKHDMLHGMTARDSRSPSMISAELEDSSSSIRSSRESMISTGSDSSIEAFHGDIVLDPSQLADLVSNTLVLICFIAVKLWIVLYLIPIIPWLTHLACNWDVQCLNLFYITDAYSFLTYSFAILYPYMINKAPQKGLQK